MNKGIFPEHIGGVIDQLVSDLGIKTKLDEHAVVAIWNDIVGEQISKVTKAARVDDSVLIVQVAAAPWRTELVFRKQEILEKIQKRVGADVVKDIRFR
jgi:predicted nucleic acid-binding Zn ribbon protein